MSGGQQQRVGIARAFVAKPKVIFADEPTGNLDSTTSRQVLYSMLEMAKSYGITFVMVTHEKELAYCGDRIVTIKDGRVLDNVLLGEDEKAENQSRKRPLQREKNRQPGRQRPWLLPWLKK